MCEGISDDSLDKFFVTYHDLVDAGLLPLIEAEANHIADLEAQSPK